MLKSMDSFDNLLTYILILNYRQDFQMLSDIGLGEGSFKSRQDSLGCVAALLNQPKVVSVANSQVLQHIFFLGYCYACSGTRSNAIWINKAKSRSEQKKEELTFVDLDLLQVAIGDSSMELKGLGSKTISKRFIDPVNKIGIKIE